MKPLFSAPLERLAETIEPMALFARTIPAEALASELDLLRSKMADGDLAAMFMAEIYEAEAARRNNPELQFDDELDAALSRLERATTAEDRHRVHEIGLQLCTIGGVDALRRAYRRMMGLGRDGTRHVRSKIMETRWAGIGGQL